MSITEAEKMTGFLDGYMAGNISANASELKHHTEKINSLIEEVKNSILAKHVDNKESIQTLLNSMDSFKSNILTVASDNDDYYNYGVEFSDLLAQIKTTQVIHPLSTEVSYLIKRAIYHFLNIAKTLKDQRIIDSATKIANQFIL